MKLRKNKFDIISNTVDNGIIVLNKDLKVLFWNKWLELRTGIFSSSILNKSILDFYSNIDEKRLKRKIITSLKLNSPTFYTPQTNDYLINIELKNVADKVFNQMQQSITISPLDIEDELVILYIYDVTLLSEINFKLKAAKEELNEKNEELRLILDTTMEAIIIFKDNKIVDCNKIALELLSKENRSDLINKNFNDIIFDQNIVKSINKDSIETVIIREDNTKFSAVINIKDAFINNQTFKILTIIDIEDIKRKENLMAEQQKLAAMGEMIANIAHQWRQPLNIISITASNLKLKNDLNALNSTNLEDSLKLILKTTEHLSNTIDTFNDFLKIDKHKSMFNVNENIKSSISLIEDFFKKFNIEIVLDLEDDIFIYNVDNEFSQAVINILNNAKDALNLNLKENDMRIIKISTKKLDEFVEISICDNAFGIDNDIVDKIFEPYFTTKHQYQGTGLGLYMTRKIINQSMGGDISVKNIKFLHNNIVCKGAMFRIQLPYKVD
ncbi:ATP-binding protein [Aliarcobacter lanthieri]|uniref:PAS domain-containing sensor histidine kinase n=1 Tax=Aliarcobacter lanthieri TaxID=1355374 RepID=UPI0004788B1A|nr:ATP-binding protein [Aliarcobacter lanthieri]QKF59052.1 PAS sensor-containing two-component system histidine kinase [Aliarcobacter lanthieri]